MKFGNLYHLPNHIQVFNQSHLLLRKDSVGQKEQAKRGNIPAAGGAPAGS
jgi:hypothetical protein